MSGREVRILHCTSQPYRFFGRQAELDLLDQALAGGEPSLVALVGPGGQGKTAIVQRWLEPFLAGTRQADGVFLWSFYRGKDSDLCLRELWSNATGSPGPGNVSASWCVDHLLPLLRHERWAIILDGTEVVQYDTGSWRGRFQHPELARLLEELAAEPLPGVVVLTSRFPLPGLETRRHARIVSLSSLDPASARGLLQSLGVQGQETELDAVAAAGGWHAKAVELLGTYLVRMGAGQAASHLQLPELARAPGASDDEHCVARVLAAWRSGLPVELQDILALATAFRDPPAEDGLLAFLASAPVASLLHQTWARQYEAFARRPSGWLQQRLQELIDYRLLERVAGPAGTSVIDAHPLVRRAFEDVIGPVGQQHSATARAGFLRGRPDRRRPDSLEEARAEVELFHAYCDAGLWNEADATFVALENPKHRFLAPAFERDLLLRFFPDRDWRRPTLWPGFGRFRSLAMCFELLGQFEDALEAYPAADWPLRGDALIALGRLQPLLDQARAPAPWDSLWRAYRCHALCLAGRQEEGVALARTLVPVDIYEWVHVFECLLRAAKLDALDLASVLFQPPRGQPHRWAELARWRMRLDYLRITAGPTDPLGQEFEDLLDAYDRGGLPFERGLTRLSFAAYLRARGEAGRSQLVEAAAIKLAKQHSMAIMEEAARP